MYPLAATNLPPPTTTTTTTTITTTTTPWSHKLGRWVDGWMGGWVDGMRAKPHLHAVHEGKQEPGGGGVHEVLGCRLDARQHQGRQGARARAIPTPGHILRRPQGGVVMSGQGGQEGIWGEGAWGFRSSPQPLPQPQPQQVVTEGPLHHARPRVARHDAAAQQLRYCLAQGPRGTQAGGQAPGGPCTTGLWNQGPGPSGRPATGAQANQAHQHDFAGVRGHKVQQEGQGPRVVGGSEGHGG